MTECTKQLIFPFFKDSKLTASFDGGTITSDGGLLLVREFDERIGLSESFSKLIYDPRDPRFIVAADAQGVVFTKGLVRSVYDPDGFFRDLEGLGGLNGRNNKIGPGGH